MFLISVFIRPQYNHCALNCRSLTNLSFDSLLEAAETLFDANDNCDVFAAEWLMPDMSTWQILVQGTIWNRWDILEIQIPNPAQRIYFRQVLFFTAGCWTATILWSRDRILKCVEIEVVVTLQCIVLWQLGCQQTVWRAWLRGSHGKTTFHSYLNLGDLHGKR